MVQFSGWLKRLVGVSVGYHAFFQMLTEHRRDLPHLEWIARLLILLKLCLKHPWNRILRSGQEWPIDVRGNHKSSSPCLELAGWGTAPPPFACSDTKCGCRRLTWPHFPGPKGQAHGCSAVDGSYGKWNDGGVWVPHAARGQGLGWGVGILDFIFKEVLTQNFNPSLQIPDLPV